MKVSVIIPVRDRENYIGACLESVLGQDIDKDLFEIIIVDNGSSDRTARIIHSYPVKYLYLKRPSISAARNLGINDSSAEYVAFIDSDAVADKSWLRELIKGFDHPRIAGCGGKILKLDGKNRQRNTLFVNQKYYIEDCELTFPVIHTGNAIFKRAFLLKTGLFDEMSLLELQLEDTDLSWRLHLAGYRLKYIDSAVVYHRSCYSIRDLLKKGYRSGQSVVILNQKYYFILFYRP